MNHTQHSHNITRILALEGRYSLSQLLLLGSSEALRELSFLLSRGQDLEIRLAAQQGGVAQPYDGFLDIGQIQIEDGRVRIFHEGPRFSISGPSKHLRLLAESIMNLAESTSLPSTVAQHMHFDPSALEFVMPDSDELVVQRE